jgi:hypothetical protein
MPRVPTMFRDHPARLAAIAAGEEVFDPGAPCWHGHQATRKVSTGACVECGHLNMLARRAKRTATRKTENNAPLAKPSCPSKAAPKLSGGELFGTVKGAPLVDRRKANTAAAHALFSYRPSRFPARYALSSYEKGDEARQHSEYLDRLTRKLA